MAEPKNRKRTKSVDAVPVAQALRERRKTRYLYAIFQHRAPRPGDDPPDDEVCGIREGGTPSVSYPIAVKAYLPTKRDCMEWLEALSPGLRKQFSYGPILVDARIQARFSVTQAGKDVLAEVLG